LEVRFFQSSNPWPRGALGVVLAINCSSIQKSDRDCCSQHRLDWEFQKNWQQSAIF